MAEQKQPEGGYNLWAMGGPQAAGPAGSTQPQQPQSKTASIATIKSGAAIVVLVALLLLFFSTRVAARHLHPPPPFKEVSVSNVKVVVPHAWRVEKQRPLTKSGERVAAWPDDVDNRYEAMFVYSVPMRNRLSSDGLSQVAKQVLRAQGIKTLQQRKLADDKLILEWRAADRKIVALATLHNGGSLIIVRYCQFRNTEHQKSCLRALKREL